jgi:hypothetical protein
VRAIMTGLDWKSKFTSAVIRPYFGEWELRLNGIVGQSFFSRAGRLLFTSSYDRKLLSGWPGEWASSQQMNVQMGDSLSAVASTIDDYPKSRLRYSERFGRFLSFKQQFA